MPAPLLTVALSQAQITRHLKIVGGPGFYLFRQARCYGGGRRCHLPGTNLNLILQVTEITSAVVVCLNLMDEARRKNIVIDISLLASQLGVPVVPAAARKGEGLTQLKDVIAAVATGALRPAPPHIVYDDATEAAAGQLARQLEPLLRGQLNARWVALRLLEGDATFLESIPKTHIFACHAIPCRPTTF